MRRREFIAGLGSAATWPFVARAQQPTVPIVALLSEGRAPLSPPLRAAFLQGLAEAGYVEGRDIAIEEHLGFGDALREFASDVVHRHVSLIATPGSTAAARAAKTATQKIPIVFGTGTDPVRLGLVPSLNRPGGNITGYTEMNSEVWSKRLGMLRALTPTAARYGVLDYPGGAGTEVIAEEARAAEKVTGLPIEIISVTDDAGVEAAFSNAARRNIGGLLVNPGAFFYSRRERIVMLASEHRVPTAYHLDVYPRAGGLMSYGSSLAEMHRQVGIYSGRVLRGAKPADLPVARATKFELVINREAAGALGLEIPPQVLAIADEVIN
jgi:putative tryptophan/tyrosine transport system substrate-binding protein